MASYITKNKKSSASTCNTEGSTTSSSPASSVNLVTTNSQQHNSVTGNNNNAPKYGTLVPNRIFVGGISVTTTETELAQLFSAYGNVKATKVISDRAGVSKGYGFVTFETEEEAKRLMRESDCIVLKERKLNIAPAIKKQPFSRTYEAASPPAVATNAVFYQNGVPYTFHNGVAYFPATPPQHATAGTGDTAGVFQTSYGPPAAGPTHSPAATAYPMIFPCTAPPTMYVAPQQFQYQPMPPPAPTSQYMYAASPSSTNAAVSGTGPPATQGSPMLGAPPTQHYYTPSPTDLYYVPYPTLVSNEGMVYETPPQTETSSTQSAEDSCSSSSHSDTVRRGSHTQLSDQDKAVRHDDKLWTGSAGQRQNTSTPVVSLLKLQDEADGKKCSSPDLVSTAPYYQQVPPPSKLMPVLYQSMSISPMFIPSAGQPMVYPVNGHSDQAAHHRVPYLPKPYGNRRNSGGSSSAMTFNIPPFPPKFHFMNNNVNPAQKRQFNRNPSGGFRTRYAGSGSGRMHRRYFGAANSAPGRNSSVEDGQGDDTSPPPAPYSPMTHPMIVPSDPSSVSPPQQVQFYSGGSRQTYYPPCNGNAATQSRRFMNNSRKPGSSFPNGGISSGSRGNGGKYSKNLVNGMQVVGVKMKEEGAGDAQGPAVQETCQQMQALSL